MKTFAVQFYLTIVFSSSLCAQYLGGSGDGAARELFRGTANGAQVATQMVITSSPVTFSVAPSQSFTVLVEIRDAAGKLAAFSSLSNASVALAIDNNPASGTLSGTTPVTAVDGLATFSGMSIDNAGFGYSLEATASPLSATSSNFDVFNLFGGGTGDGAARESSLVSTQNGLPVVVWQGGGVVGSEKDWATAGNWLGGTVPTQTDAVFIEANGTGDYPILSADIRVGALHFNGAQKVVELGNFSLTVTEAIFDANSSQYIKTNGTGSLRKGNFTDGSSFTFPVGNSSYNPLSITNNTQATDTFSVRVLDEIYEYGTSGNALTDPRVKRTWDIGKENPTANLGNGVDFVFNWNSGDVSNPAPTTYALFHHDANGNGWGQVVNGTGTQNGNSFSFTGYKGSFSPFGIGDQNLPLPVELLYFNGSCQPQGLDFRWATAAEVNSQSFTLEHSANLVEWQALHTQPAAGFSSSQKDYSVQLPHQAHLGPYFRLHQEDFDGKFERFAPLHLECSETTNAGLRLFPNPARDAVWVSGIAGTLDWEIFDARGRLLRSGQLNMDMEAQQLPTHGLPAGLYLFQTPNARLPLMLQE
jgi:hypothetical protein